jgi:hypothetical protein
MITWASIPYTEDANEAIEFLQKYGHSLVLNYKTEYSFNDSYRCRMDLKCKICDIMIILGRYGGSEKEYRICVANNLNETAMFYCEKYRALY